MKITFRIFIFIVFVGTNSSLLMAQLGPQTLGNEKPVFSHQYTYLSSERYFFIDTSFNSLHWYHQYNHRGKDNFDYSVLGSMGNPMNDLTMPHKSGIWNYYSLGAYEPYFSNQNTIPFYYTRSPITEANYWMGYDRGQSFNIYHTQNVNENWNVLLNYSRLNDLGFYAHNRNIKSRFLANSAYINKDIGYEVRAYYLLEKMLTEENGGLLNRSDSILETPGARVLLDVNLLDDSRNLKQTEFFIDQNYNLAKLFDRDEEVAEPDTNVVEGTKDNSDEQERGKVAIGHTFKLIKRSNAYSGASTDFYDNYFFEENNYRDSSGYKSYENTFYLLTEIGQKAKFDLKAGLKNLTTNYGGADYTFVSTNWGLSGNIGGRVGDRVNIRGSVDYILTGRLKESFEIGGTANLQIVEWLRAFGGYSLSSKYPGFFESVYFSNNFIWENNFSKEILNRINYGLGWGKSNQLEITNFIANNYVYFDQSGRPAQSTDAINVFRAKLVQNFTLWNFVHQDNNVYYQKVGGNSQVLPLPEIVTRNSLYFEFHLFKRVLKCLWGAEVKYFSEYNSPSYSPATARFYVANERSVGGYPLVDLFMNFELRSARIFLKYEHVNEGLSGYDYFASPNYPFPDRVLRVGITWRFFN